jgi:hypothetical protein
MESYAMSAPTGQGSTYNSAQGQETTLKNYWMWK